MRNLGASSHSESSAVISADASEVLTASEDATVKVYDASTGRCERTVEGHQDITLPSEKLLSLLNYSIPAETDFSKFSKI